MVIPGCVSPSSGPITCTIPCAPDDRSNSRIPASRQFRSSAASMSSAITSRKRAPLIARRHDVIDGCDRSIRMPHAPPARPQHVECLRTGHFVDQMQPDEQLCLPVRQPPHSMRIPDFLQKRRTHSTSDRTTLARSARAEARGSGLGARGSGLGARGSLDAASQLNSGVLSARVNARVADASRYEDRGSLDLDWLDAGLSGFSQMRLCASVPSNSRPAREPGQRLNTLSGRSRSWRAVIAAVFITDF